jgi:hypothetical protein
LKKLKFDVEASARRSDEAVGQRLRKLKKLKWLKFFEAGILGLVDAGQTFRRNVRRTEIGGLCLGSAVRDGETGGESLRRVVAAKRAADVESMGSGRCGIRDFRGSWVPVVWACASLPLPSLRS